MSTGWNVRRVWHVEQIIINLLGNEYWLERQSKVIKAAYHYKPTGK